jgi:hypothetical protein
MTKYKKKTKRYDWWHSFSGSWSRFNIVKEGFSQLLKGLIGDVWITILGIGCFWISVRYDCAEIVEFGILGIKGNVVK